MAPWRSSFLLEYPCWASSGSGGTVLIDDDLKRVIYLDAGGEAKMILKGGERGAGKFFFAQEVLHYDAQGKFPLH